MIQARLETYSIQFVFHRGYFWWDMPRKPHQGDVQESSYTGVQVTPSAPLSSEEQQLYCGDLPRKPNKLVLEPKLCVEASPNISSCNFSTLRPSSDPFPVREVIFPNSYIVCNIVSALWQLASSRCTQPALPIT